MKENLRYESLEDALMFCIRASNKEIKEVAAALWPTMQLQTSYQRLIDALNPSKNQKISVYEVIYIMHFCDRYDPLLYICDECLYERPAKKSLDVEQKDVKEMLSTMFNEATKSYQTLLNMIEKREKIEKIKMGTVSFLDRERKIG